MWFGASIAVNFFSDIKFGAVWLGPSNKGWEPITQSVRTCTVATYSVAKLVQGLWHWHLCGSTFCLHQKKLSTDVMYTTKHSLHFQKPTWLISWLELMAPPSHLLQYFNVSQYVMQNIFRMPTQCNLANAFMHWLQNSSKGIHGQIHKNKYFWLKFRT